MNNIDELIQEKRKAETQFAAAVLANPESALKDYAYFVSDFFHSKQIGKFWKSFQETGDAYKAANNAGMVAELSKVGSEIPDLSRLDVYAGQLTKMSQILDIVTVSQEVSKACWEQDLDSALESLDKISTVREKVSQGIHGLQRIEQVASNFESDIMGNPGWDSISMSLLELDRAAGKLQRKQLSIVASRTSVGKTAFALQVASHACGIMQENLRLKVVYFSTESSQRDLWARMCAAKEKIDWRKIASGESNQDERNRIVQGSRDLAARFKDYLWIDDMSLSLQDIHRSVATIRPDLVIVDHLDELPQPASVENRAYWLGQAAHYLKYLGKRYNAHVMCVHQMNRESEKRTEHRPTLQDLRGSGDLEQIADLVLMPYREDVYDQSNHDELTEVPVEFWIKKNRFGPRDIMVALNYNLITQKFIKKSIM